ncbi:MAG TPA: S-methyl-5-thioribose-1-phosphate isomerase [Candidatus Krumholzibacteria bacterium]|nr:S-methyl-5-thioribose-1-phosphate isomerase [Candidatus Krumholzibacteria bacterium]
MVVDTILYRDGAIEIIDQTRLPSEHVVLQLRSLEALCEAIRMLRIRGAPALGVAAAYGFQLEAELFLAAGGKEVEALRARLLEAGESLARTRPTARNLFGAVERLGRVVAAPATSAAELATRVAREAAAVHAEDRALCEAIAAHGAGLLPQRARVLTHCNAGALATGGIGTALGVVYAAVQQGKSVEVFADETRPLLQGARLTAWELQRAGIPVTVLCDNAAPSLLASGRIDCVVVGADRIARNGDTANKIGTFGVALAARRCGIPFYVAAPSTTFDLSLASGRDIPIEERAASEVTTGAAGRSTPAGVEAYNPAFDVTPADLITAIVHEGGVVRPPYEESLPASLAELGAAAPRRRG